MTGWQRALAAASLLSHAPGDLRGMVIRARPGPVRDRYLSLLTHHLPGPILRCHPDTGEETLIGGLDLVATLAAGRPIEQAGLLTRAGTLLVPTAERTGPSLAATLAHAIDRDEAPCLIILDEGAEPGEAPPAALAERLAFHVTLDDLPWRSCGDGTILASPPRDVAITSEILDASVQLSTALGIGSARAPLLTLAATRAAASLRGSDTASTEDLAQAADLVLAHRATCLPSSEADDDPTEPDPGPEQTEHDPADETRHDTGDDIPTDVILEAIATRLDPALLAELAVAQTLRVRLGSGAGARRQGNRRGRPLGAKPGRLAPGRRIDIVATLRAAAPWQRIRADARPGHSGLHLRPSDIRLRRFEDRSDRLLIFMVDASGSAAMARLAEAKGALEYLLAEAYARRDTVALVSFRGTGAEILLPPTRSLVQAKRRLAGLPGGGGTPLAAGLRAGAELATQMRGRGLSPALILLSDGRANISLDGQADRAKAAQDATHIARLARGEGLPALVLDTAIRPQAALADLARDLGARYAPVPRADARAISSHIQGALGT